MVCDTYRKLKVSSNTFSFNFKRSSFPKPRLSICVASVKGYTDDVYGLYHVVIACEAD